MKRYCRISLKRWASYLTVNGISAFLGVLIAGIIQVTIDAAGNGQWKTFGRIVVFSSVFLICYLVFQYGKIFYTQKLSNDFIAELRNCLYQAIIRKSYSGFEERNVSDYLSVLTNDIHLYQEGRLKSQLLLIQNSITLVIVTAALIYINPVIALFVIGCSFVTYLLPGQINKKIAKAQIQVSEGLGAFTEYTRNHLEGFYTLCTYGYQGFSIRGFSEKNEDYNDKKSYMDRTVGKSESLSAFLSVGTELCVLFLSAGLVLRGSLSAGTMVAIMQLTGSFVLPLTVILQNIPRISGGKALEEKFLSILSDTPAAEEFSEKAKPWKEKITLKNLTYAYKGQEPVLKEINWKIEKNKKYVLVGKSGSGKTTLINVINGIYTDYSGEIELDDNAVDDKSRQVYRNLFATAGQSVFLFNTTIRNNITLENAENPAREKELERICRICKIQEVLQNLPAGLDTRIQNGGENLSGGQRQRIALARALYHGKKILILDEGTSALDRKTAYEIEENLLKDKELTLIVITHDLTSPLLEQYDEILYLKDGTIRKGEAYQELLFKSSQVEKGC